MGRSCGCLGADARIQWRVLLVLPLRLLVSHLLLLPRLVESLCNLAVRWRKRMLLQLSLILAYLTFSYLTPPYANVSCTHSQRG